jgi:folate-binding protein YgfZ
VNTFACTLEGEALIHLRGARIAEFLQGQLTCDLRRLAPDAAVAGVLCNPKGRVLTDLKVVQVSEEHSVLRLRRSLAASIAETLQRYAQFSRIAVALEPRTTALAGVYGDLDALPAEALPLPGGIDQVVRSAGVVVVRHGAAQLELIAVDADDDRALPALVAALPAGAGSTWQAEFLAAGHYALEEPDSGQFTPQALNFDLTGRVAFDKGCYTGQEVVARLHYKGQSKRRLAVYETPQAGNATLRDQPVLDERGETIGSCLRTERDRHGRLLLAAQVISERTQLPAKLADGSQLTPLPSP